MINKRFLIFIIVLIIIFIGVFYLYYLKFFYKNNYNPTITGKPYQKNLIKAVDLEIERYTITKRAEYNITARVLSIRKYNDTMSDLGKYDFALGWAKMSDMNILENIVITQSNRKYIWNAMITDDISITEIEENSANNHLFTNNSSILNKIKKIKKNDIVNIKGYLVSITSKDGWYINSSLTRKDTGNNACEVIWVESIDILN